MQQVFPLPGRDLDVEEVYRDLSFPGPPPGRPYVLLNFVSTIDGQTTLGKGGATGIGSKTDHRLMRRLRVTADALLHGAGTVSKDNFPPMVPADLEGERIERGLTAQPFGVVVSASGNLRPENRYFTRPGSVILTSDQQVGRLVAIFGDRAEVVGCGDGRVDLGYGLGALRDRFGVRVLLCEGGPKLTHDLVAEGYLDEIFLTVAPKLAGDPNALRLLDGHAFRPDSLPRAELRHILIEDSELFLRYRLDPAPVALA